MLSPQLYDLQQQFNSKIPQENKTMTNDSSLVNLNNKGISQQTQALLKQYQLAQFCQQNGDYSDLDNPEISMNLQTIIDESQLTEGLISDILHTQNKHIEDLQSRQVTDLYASNNFSRTLPYIPQPVHSSVVYPPRQMSRSSESSSSFSSEVPSIKEEPFDPDYFSTVSSNYISPISNSAFSAIGSNSMQHQINAMRNKESMMRKTGKQCDKSSDEYKKKRIRNNIAVRKSREKANIRKREIEEKNGELLKENQKLHKQLDSLTEELNMLKSLISTFGILPEHFSKELSKHV